MRYNGILFDADDTLFDFQAGNRNAVNALMDEIGYLHPDRYGQYEAENLACWAELEQGRLTQDALRTERFRRFYAKYGIDPYSPEIRDEDLDEIADSIMVEIFVYPNKKVYTRDEIKHLLKVIRGDYANA